MRYAHLFVPALALGALVGASAANAQIINFTSTVTLTNPTNNGVTITASGSSDTNVNAAGLGTSDVVGGFQVATAPAPPPYTPYMSAFTDVLMITDQLSGVTKNLTVTGKLSTSANSSQVLPGSTSITLDQASYELDFAVNRYFVSMNNFDEVAAPGASRVGSFSYRFKSNQIPSNVPEPGAVAMLSGMATTGLGVLTRRRKAARKTA